MARMSGEPSATDVWHQWLLSRRSGGDEKLARVNAALLAAVRDRVLQYAGIRDGDTLLDVGSGDGLIAFGALDRVGAGGHVVFSDISQPLLDHARTLATEAGAIARCSFVQASAEDLAPVASGSVDVVTTRSVLIYVKDKRRAFAEFFRVLRPGGRISLFEPINRIDFDARAGNRLWGVDMTPVLDLAQRLRAVYYPPEAKDSPMLDFDERDLARMAEEAGFATVHLRLDYNFEPETPPAVLPSYDALIHVAPNPLAPTLAEAMQRVFTPEERERFEAHMRPQVEAGQVWRRSAVTYLQARKAS